MAGIHFVENEANEVLVPQPSSNADDPLNWSPLWKGIMMTSMVMTAFVQSFGPLAVVTQIPLYMAEWPERSIADILQFVSLAPDLQWHT